MKFVKPLKLYEDLLRRNQGRFLGLCLHDKHVHLAVSDPDNIVAVPLSAINREECNMDLMADKFRTLISKHNSTGFVVGFPYLKSSRVNCSSEMVVMRRYAAPVKDFINELCKNEILQGVNYTYWDEVIVTEHMDFVVKHNVEFIIKNLNESVLKSEQIVEKFVAARMLKGYLDYAISVEELEKKDSH